HMGDANNFFGIKAQEDKNGKVTFGNVATGFIDKLTKEFKNGKAITVVAHFRAYKDMAGSFIDHGIFLTTNARYLKALKAYKETKGGNEIGAGVAEGRLCDRPQHRKDAHSADDKIRPPSFHRLKFFVPRRREPLGLPQERGVIRLSS